MNQITALNNSFSQQTNISLDDGSTVQFTISYVPNNQGWYYSLQYKDFIINNCRLVCSPNFLRAFRNVIPFGMACSSIDGYEPLYLDDFTSGRISIFSLSPSDVLLAENTITVDIPNSLGIILK